MSWRLGNGLRQQKRTLGLGRVFRIIIFLRPSAVYVLTARGPKLPRAQGNAAPTRAIRQIGTVGRITKAAPWWGGFCCWLERSFGVLHILVPNRVIFIHFRGILTNITADRTLIHGFIARYAKGKCSGLHYEGRSWWAAFVAASSPKTPKDTVKAILYFSAQHKTKAPARC